MLLVLSIQQTGIPAAFYNAATTSNRCRYWQKKPVSVNSDCSIAYLIELSCLLIKRLSSPKKVLTAAGIGLWGMVKGGAGPETKNDKLVGLEIEIEDKQAGKTLDSCT